MELVEQFVHGAPDATHNGSGGGGALGGESQCRQMIMGAGKTTVIAPLLCLMLADGRRSVVQVVPGALLDMSREVLWGCFTAALVKVRSKV